MNSEVEQRRRLDKLRSVREWMEAISLVVATVTQGKSDEELDEFCLALAILVEHGRRLEEAQ